jgi:hypothetical protein
MMKQFTCTLILSLLLFLVVGCQGNSPKLAWQITTGLQQPESVVQAVNNDGFYISNINGKPSAIDGNGFISLVANDGAIKDLKWVDGLNAPKGMSMHDNTLYVADIDELVVIDVPTARVTHRFSTNDDSFLNDVATTRDGIVYVSDTAKNLIYQLKDKSFEIWLEDKRLENPNGLYIDNEHIVVSSWGQMVDSDWNTDIPGHILLISQQSKQIKDFASNAPIGNLDGIVKLDNQNFLVTDWMNGKLMQVSTDGEIKTLLELGQGSADMLYMHNEKLLLIPQMLTNKLLAYNID